MPSSVQRRIAVLVSAVLGLAVLGLLVYLNRKPIRAWAFRGPEYVTAFATVGGLRPGDEVRYGGLPTGRIKAIGIDAADRSRIVVRFAVREDVMDSSAPELRAAAGELPPLLRDTRLLLADLREGAAQGGGPASLMQDLTVAGDHLARVTSRLERDPASLLRSRRPPPKSAGPELHD